jgi:hypothetical protein
MTLWLSEEATLRVSESADVGPRKNIVYTPEGTHFVILAALTPTSAHPVSRVVSCVYERNTTHCIPACQVLGLRCPAAERRYAASPAWYAQAYATMP